MCYQHIILHHYKNKLCGVTVNYYFFTNLFYLQKYKINLVTIWCLERYASIAHVLTELLPCLLPHADTQVTSIWSTWSLEIDMISFGTSLHRWCLDSTHLSWSKIPSGRTRSSLTLPLYPSFPIGSRPRKPSSKTIAPAELHFSPHYTSQHMPMQLPLSCCVSQTTCLPMMMDSSHLLFASWVSPLCST